MTLWSFTDQNFKVTITVATFNNHSQVFAMLITRIHIHASCVQASAAVAALVLFCCNVAAAVLGSTIVQQNQNNCSTMSTGV